MHIPTAEERRVVGQFQCCDEGLGVDGTELSLVLIGRGGMGWSSS
jgi:hypothetical protein